MSLSTEPFLRACVCVCLPSRCSLRDLGLEQYDTVELFAKILLPATFLLACILQLHYFNNDFLELTDLDNVPVRQGADRSARNATTNL